MKKKDFFALLLLSFALMSGADLNAQQSEKIRSFGKSVFYEQLADKAQNNNGTIKCAAFEYDKYLNSINSEKETIDEFESWLAPKIEAYKQKNQTRKTSDENIITIPVVVHVIHDDKAVGVDENIADAQIISQITILNQDYRKMLGTPGYNTNPVGADTEIEFCLAQRTPNGQATTGINRLSMATPVMTIPGWGEFTTWDMDEIELNLKPATIWDPDEYLNIWVVDNILLGMVAGYAQFPESSGLEGLEGGGLSTGASTDGVVISHYCFGSADIYPQGTYNFPYNKGRTTTHEVGHWLGLRHIWGDNDSCNVNATDSLNDYCLDTPPADDANEGCAQTSTCSVPSMYQNYMDYTNDSCQNIFTEDQKMRMRTVLENSLRRNTLAASSGCLPPSEFDAKIGIINMGEDCEVEVLPVIMLSNIGTTTVINSAEISYEIEGETVQTYNWTGTLNTESEVEIALPLVEFQQTSDFTVNLVSINNTIDDNTLNNSKTITKTIPSSFVSSSVTLFLTTDNWGDETSWELINNDTGTIVSQGGDYFGNQTISQSFQLTDGCYTFTIFDQYGDGICCEYGQGSYTLTSGSQTIISGGSFGESESTSFVINSAASIGVYNPFGNIAIYPNPVNSILNIDVTNAMELPENIVIYNALGQTVKNHKVNGLSDFSVDVSSLANGVYLLKLTGQNQNKIFRFIKQ